jgi:hypothetical protein
MAKRIYKAEIGDGVVRIGGWVYEPRSGKQWRTDMRWKGYETYRVSSKGMKAAKKALTRSMGF